MVEVEAIGAEAMRRSACLFHGRVEERREDQPGRRRFIGRWKKRMPILRENRMLNASPGCLQS